MASGKKNYFRHSFFAGKDDKIVNLIADHGKQAYFHYFRLLELCGELSAEEVPASFVFHRRTLCAELMVTNSRLGHHLLAIQSSLLAHVVLGDRKVEIVIPNLSKYLGRYTNKNPSNCSNKSKVKERKEKESNSDGLQPSREEEEPLTHRGTFSATNKNFVHPDADLGKTKYNIKTSSGDTRPRDVRDIRVKIE